MNKNDRFSKQEILRLIVGEILRPLLIALIAEMLLRGLGY